MGDLVNYHYLLITTVAGIITTIITTVVTIYRENRNRRWDQEDRERSRRDLEAKVDLHQKVIARKTDEQTKVIVDKIADNTKISENAFAAANGVNEKLLMLARQFDSIPVSDHIAKQVSKIPEIQRVSEDTNQLVRGIIDANDKT